MLAHACKGLLKVALTPDNLSELTAKSRGAQHLHLLQVQVRKPY
jgi:hypothetical protein